MKKIVIITFYYGHFGKDIEFWFHSIKNNPTIDFLIFTDLEVPIQCNNLIVIHKSFMELVEYAQQKFSFKICVPEPYKFPDFRPAFGEIFSDYLKGYDFWGFCDTDLVLGDIRAFMTNSLLEKYDKLLAMGHFSLYRNIPEVNTMYMKCEEPNYQQVFTFPRNSAFEEYFGTSRYWAINLPDKFYKEIPFDDLDCYKYPFIPQFRKKEDKGKNYFIYSYEHNKLYRIYEMNGKLHKDETMYVHFQKRKMEIKTNVQEKFMMIPNAYIPFIENLDINKLRSFDVSQKWYPHAYILQCKRVINKWKKIKASLHPSKFGIPMLPIDGINYYK
jgi:hypothetical protein